ncbi:unnamed protein product [Arctia plantaginis]|uniref:Phosphatidic acid phosphatase type 2/haloperoxidase domain-containing protein n=1 Tax=Arctia plantaginis TaxID=874455 RepID=A0A8S1AAM4_ARCPL|nr:unnamed protein product [Arctia plantaginis]
MTQEGDTINILKKVVVDAVIILLLTVCTLLSNLVWVPFERGFFCDDESLMYPYKSDTVTVPVLRIVGVCLPILAFLICEWNVLRKDTTVVRCYGVPIPTWVRGFYCVLASFAVGCCFTELAINTSKAVIGRPRPHFFSICQPSVNCSLSEWKGRYVLPTDYTCTGPDVDKIHDVRKSFLSGHSAFSAFTMFYLAMYLEKRIQFKGSCTLRHTLSFIAVLLSWFCALSRVSDYKHHWSDVLAGYTLGILLAVVMWNYGTELVQKEKKSIHCEPAAVSPPVTNMNGVH